MTDYDLWISTNPEDEEADKFNDAFAEWLDKFNEEELADILGIDLTIFVTESSLDWDYPDVIIETIIDSFQDDLEEYFRNNDWEC